MLRDLARSLLAVNTRFARDTRGASATILAMALPVLIGFESLGAETGVWYMIKRQNQSAADAAAITAAYEVIAGKTDIAGELTQAAIEAAEQNGYKGASPAISYPYSDGTVEYGVAVTLQQTQRAFFASMFLPGVTIAAKAVAVIKALDNPCILALAKNGAGVKVGDSSTLELSGCSIAANSTSSEAIEIHRGVGPITAAVLVTAGEISFNGSPIDPAALPREFIMTSPPMIGAPDISDPYARTFTHAFLSSAISGVPEPTNTWIGVTKTINPGLYDGGMSIRGGAVIDLTPGVYYVTNGNLSIASSATVTCKTCNGVSGVTIVLTTTSAIAGGVGNAQISRGATVTLQAPNAGAFSGYLFVQDPLAASAGGGEPDNALDGGPGMNLTGLVYFPNTTVGFRGNPKATCTLLIASRIAINGNSRLTTSGCTTGGLIGLPTVYTATLAE